MAYTVAELSGPVQYGDDKKKFFYDAEDASDSLATVLATGYFNNEDDNTRFAVDDQIEVRTSAGKYVLDVIAVSTTGAGVTTHLVGGEIPIETGATSASLSGYGLSVLAAAATGQERIYRLPAPVRAGQRKSLLASVATDHSVISTGGWTYYPSGNGSITLIGDATLGASVELIARSTTQWTVTGYQLSSTGARLSTTA